MLPLQGIRVLDLGVVWAGPFATQILADMGAEVIKVENIHVWQPLTRGAQVWPTEEYLATQTPFTGGYPDRKPGRRPWNCCPTFNNMFRNKLSMTVDLRTDEGKGIFRRLLKLSDVVYENNVPETMDKLGITYDFLRSVTPDIICVRAPAYGLSGSYRNYRALGVHLEATIGHTLLRGYPDLDPTASTAVYMGDYAAGAQGAFAVLSALIYRRRTGKGQFIELAQGENAITFLGEAVMDYILNGRVHTTLGNRDYHGAAPCGCYRCRGQDRWVNITVHNDAEWQGFCRALVYPAWTQDPAFADAASRRQNQDALDRHVEEWTSQRDHYEVMHLLQKEGVPAGPVLDPRDCFQDPHIKARSFFSWHSHPDCGTHLYPGLMFKFSETPLGVRRRPCCLGEDNEYVYREVLGFSEEEYRQAEAAGHIGTEYAPDIP